MKSLFIFCCFILAGHISFARKDTTITYCNVNGVKMKKELASHYLKAYKKSNKSYQVDKYTIDGEIQVRQAYSDKKHKVKEGNYEKYYRNNSLNIKGNYTNNQQTGTWTYYHKSGTKSTEGEYIADERSGKWLSWDEEGQKTTEKSYITGKEDGLYQEWINGNLIQRGTYKMAKKTGLWEMWNEDGQLDSKGNYIEGERDGEWNFYFRSGQLASKEIYENGEAINVKWWNEDGSEKEYDGNLETEPEFPGGTQKMGEFIGQKVNYPEMARSLGEQGIVYVQFTINTDGSLSNIKVVKGISESLNAEAVRVIGLMPNWSPGIHHNRMQNVKFVLPIHFRMG